MFEKGEDGKLYNTTPVIDSKGKLIGKSRKSHMEKDVPGKYEINIGLTPDPDTYPVHNTEFGKIGVIRESRSKDL
jgi:predicted amidohydrolase